MNEQIWMKRKEWKEMKENKWMNRNEWADMNEQKWMKRNEWKGMHEQKWRKRYEGKEMNEKKWMNEGRKEGKKERLRKWEMCEWASEWVSVLPTTSCPTYRLPALPTSCPDGLLICWWTLIPVYHNPHLTR